MPPDACPRLPRRLFGEREGDGRRRPSELRGQGLAGHGDQQDPSELVLASVPEGHPIGDIPDGRGPVAAGPSTIIPVVMTSTS